MNKFVVYGIVAIVFIALGGFLIHSYGNAKKSEGEALVTAKANEQIVKKVKSYEKAKVKVRSVSDDELIKRYCKFVYDITYDKCVSDTRIIVEDITN